eukprot:scaffold1875_cov146-Skeletonema_dohrnii-CCMP3373.AAC.4
MDNGFDVPITLLVESEAVVIFPEDGAELMGVVLADDNEQHDDYTAKLLLTKYINQCHAPLMSQIHHQSIPHHRSPLAR